jgi:hypothetical protein
MIRIKFIVGMIGFVGFSSFFYASCGGSSNSNPAPAATPIPAASVNPSPSPSPSASPSESPWIQVREEQTCPFLLCAARVGFTVDAEGNYFVGGALGGHVSIAQLGQLNAIASLVASQNETTLQCSIAHALPGLSASLIELTLADGTTETIYEVDPDLEQSCFAGSLENAKALYQTVNGLASQYDPEAVASPSPSASPSTSPSPSPSVTILAH